METIINLNEINAQDFRAFFSNQKKIERKNFVFEHRDEFSTLSNVEVLHVLCEFGFFHVLPRLIEVDANHVNQEVIRFLSASRRDIRSAPSLKEKKEIWKYAASKLEIIKFLKENTSAINLQDFLYEFASPDVANYLFKIICNEHYPISIKVGSSLFKKCRSELIDRFIRSSYGLDGGSYFFSLVMMRNLALREDIPYHQRQEMIMLACNRSLVSQTTIRALRVENLIDF